MADITLITDRPDDLTPLVNGLTTAGHRPTVTGSDALPGEGDSAALIVVDAVKDLARARDACKTLRSASTRLPIVVLIGADSLEAVGPDWDIDSFCIDPPSIPEALARIRLALGSNIIESSQTIKVGDLHIDPNSYQVRLRARPLDLTYKEFQLLSYLAARPGRVFSRQQLLSEVWGYDFFGGTRTVDVHVRRLRAKLGAEYEAMIVTIRNVGYKLEATRER